MVSYHFSMTIDDASSDTFIPVNLFLSHASEDKIDFVEPLAHELKKRKFEVWYDKFILTLGDSLLQKISQGLRECDYGVVVLSPAFFAKKWPKAELDGLFALEDSARKVILPVWKDVNEADVKQFSPILASKLAVRASEGLLHVVEMIEQAVTTGNKVAAFSPEQAIKARFAKLSQNINTNRESSRMLSSTEGVQLLHRVVHTCFQKIESLAVDISSGTGLQFQAKARSDQYSQPFFALNAPFNLGFNVGFDNLASNSAAYAVLMISAWHTPVNDWGARGQPSKIRSHHFKPLILDDLSIQWNSVNEVPSQSLLTEQIPAYFMQIVAFEVEKAAEAAKKTLE